MNIVWFKKDLRAFDHQPLAKSIDSGKTVGLFIIEDEWLQSPEFDQIHLNFVLESLMDLKEALALKGVPLIVRQGHALQVFQDLHREHKIKHVFSHEETGLLWSFQRDIKISNWLKENSIPWVEMRQFAVIRKLKDRDSWNDKRKKILERPLSSTPSQDLLKSPWSSFDHLIQEKHVLLANKKTQKGGRKQALHFLNSFLQKRGENYFRSMSSPNTAFESCSRLSPYITWGNISLSEIHQALNKKRSLLKNEFQQKTWNLSLKNFESRLAWHCHFIQKLETEPEIEFENFNREFDGLRESEFNESYFQAWCRGETGFPMIDACMRALHIHGWINFRMRAMLMSFASYQLWLHWKKPAEYLARQFLDFEPGIHYSQAQMQSGVTGINSIRVYSPKKQAIEQDPSGEFIREYVPELRDVPLVDLWEPHQIPPLLQLDSGFKPGSTYPLPIVDPEKSYQSAKEKIFQWKKMPKVKKASKVVLERHGSRKSPHFPEQKRD